MITNFAQAGNLAFYEGWSPDYVYFKSLTKYAWADLGSKKTKGAWSTERAGERAATAAMDAVSHSVLPGMTQEQHDSYFLTKMSEIVAFLQKAIAYEYSNEKQYFDLLLKELRKNFTKEEREKIKEVNALEDTINKSAESGIVPLDKINTLCNLILQGQDNMETILTTEGKRVEAVQHRIEEIVKGRGNQAAGVGYSKGKSQELQEIMRENAQNRLQRKILAEYTETKQLSRVDKKTGKAILYGGKSIEEIANQTISKHFASWIEQMIAKVSSDGKFIDKLAKKIEGQYPVNGNFKLLSDDIQESVIQVIIDSGLHDLKETIQQAISDELVKHIEKNIMRSIDDNGVLDVTAELNITNLDNTFGRHVKEPELMKNISSIQELEKKSAVELFSYVDKLMEEEKEVIQKNPKKSESYLIQAMAKSTAITDETILERTNNIISLIHEIEKIRKKINKFQEEYDAQLKKLHKTEIEFQKEIKLSKNSKATIKVSVVNGKVQVDQDSLIAALKKDNRYNSFALRSFNVQTLTSTLQTLKSRASKILRQEIINALKASDFGISEEKLISEVRQELRSLNISIDGPTLAELITTLQLRQSRRGAVVWDQTHGKNDSVHILIDKSKVRSKALLYAIVEDRIVNDFEAKIQQAQIDLLHEYQKVIDKQADSIQKDGQRYSKMDEVLNTDILNRENLDENLETAYKRLESLVNEYVAYLKKNTRDETGKRNIEKYRAEFLNVLQSSFYVSTTVKSHNDYVNQLGFVGGSLGGHLDQQLSNIADIFSSAGLEISASDMMWLKSAIINCFPGSMVGEKNKDTIEQYLGSLMAFALFDEGGVEAKIINNLSDKIVQTGKHNSRKILHLYNVNGIYVTGSTVLKRTLDSIQQDVITNMQKIPEKIGAGITIINPASENMIPNRPYKEYITSADSGAWEITGTRVAESVQLKILFLAGLLDIINSINKTLGNIETV